MALFLETTSYSSSNYKGSLETIAIDGIALIHEEMQLMEAIYQADFIMHEQNKNLSESARVLKEGNFLVNVYRKVIEWVKKAWEWIKNFFSKIKDKVVEIYNRIKDHMTGNTKSMANKALKKAELIVDKAKDLIRFIKNASKIGTLDEAKKLSKNWETYVKEYDRKVTAADKLKGSSNVSMTWADKLKELPGELGKEAADLVQEILADLTDAEKELDKDVKKAGTSGSLSDDDNKHNAAEALNNKEPQELIHAKRYIVTFIQGTAAKTAAEITAGITGLIASSKEDANKEKAAASITP